MTNPDAISIAHVADVLAAEHGCADYAANLLRAYMFLRIAADNYAAGTEPRESLAFYVGQAVKFNASDGSF